MASLFALKAERGQALLILLAMMSVAVVLLVYGSTTEVGRSIKADTRTRIALEQARQALIGRAVADANRPGSLPCPDGDDDGSADLFVGSNCPSYLGRLPWRTLGVGDLRDEAGERLWYALSPNFRDHPAAPALNSATKGTLALYSGADAVSITTQAVALVFAPGAALPGQPRDDIAALCSSTAKTAQRSRCAANYLDIVAKLNNAAAAGPYIAAPVSELFNDKIAVIVTADLMPFVERRVSLDLRNALLAYQAGSACECYPWPASGKDGISTPGTSRGRVPSMTASPQNWAIGALPAYFAANDWASVIHYAVARSALENAGKNCSTCIDASLSVDGVDGYDVVLVTYGHAGADRPGQNWNEHVDDAENRNDDDRFVTPPPPSRNHVYAIAGNAAGCGVTARVLMDNAPCGAPAKSVRPVCQSASAALTGCRCADAAGAIIRAPCSNALGSQPCDAALNQLRACGP